jgi:hypothetical protein
MAASDKHKCAISDCSRKIARTMLMCKPHWAQVPKPLQNRVWTTYRFNGVLSEEYWEAREAAIHSVEVS